MSQKISAGKKMKIDMLFNDWLAASKGLERKALEYKKARESSESAKSAFIKEFAEAYQASPGDIDALLSSL